jgi:hypothetical protein
VAAEPFNPLSSSEKCRWRPECVAPTVLRISMANVPSPSGLGYILPHLRRWGLVAIDLGMRVVSRDSGMATGGL